MATVLFAHDGFISKIENDIYSDTYNNKIVERYQNIAENIIFLVREKGYYGNNKNLNKINIPNLKVVGIKNFKNLSGILGYRLVKEKVYSQVEKADYIIARVPSDLGFLAIDYAIKLNKRYLVEVVGCPWDSYRNHSNLGKVIAPYYFIKQRKYLNKAPYALYVTNEFLQKRYPCNGENIGCSDVELNYTDEHFILNRLEKIKMTDIRSLEFATIGTLNMKYKGYDTVIKTIAYLNNNGYSFKYSIAGNGDTLWLENLINKYNASNFVKIVSAMPHEEVFTWLDKIDIYIQPSKTEGMPRALIEAMSRGLPCIGTNAGGIPELLDKDSIFKVGSSKQLLGIINDLSEGVLKNWAIKNLEKTKTFRFEELNEKRISFYNIFKKDSNYEI